MDTAIISPAHLMSGEYFLRQQNCIFETSLKSRFYSKQVGGTPLSPHIKRLTSITVAFCQTPVLGLGLGVDFTFALDHKN